MTKMEYLSALDHYFRELSPEERQKQLDYYGEMLADMLEDGLSMDEIGLRLGTPKALAEEVLASMGRPLPAGEEPKTGPVPTAPAKKLRPVWPWIVLGVVAVALLLWLLAGLLFGAPKNGLLGMLQREIREEVWDELDLDEARRPTPSPMPWPTPSPMPQPADAGAGSYAVASSGLHGVEVEWTSGHVTVKPADGGSIQFSVDGEGEPHWYTDEGTLVIQAPREPLLFGAQPDLTVYLPAGMAELEVDTASGDISVKNIAVTELSLSAASGSLTVVGTAAELDLSTTSGSIFAALEGLCRELDIESTSGDIEISGEVADFEAESTSGAVNASFSNTPQALGVTTSSGNVYLSLPADAQFSCSHNSASGQLYNAFAHKQHNGEPYYIVRTSSGNLNITAN